MGNRIFRIFHLVVMALALVALVAMLILQIVAGASSSFDKVYMALFSLLIVWAAVRVYMLAKELRRK